MDHDAFIAVVEQAGAGSRDAAERAARAVLETLAERIDQGERRDLADRLSGELAPWLSRLGPAEAFHVREFLRRVAEREGVDPATAERHARAVFAALGRALPLDQLEDVRAQLPKDFEPLLTATPGEHVDVVALDRFLDRVAAEARTDRDTARRATEAVLETLGERIGEGEAEDLTAQLPVALHEPLLRGAARSDGSARRLRADAFVARVAGREAVDVETAIAHARAVFAVLREAVTSEEFYDLSAQLPRDYAELGAKP